MQIFNQIFTNISTLLLVPVLMFLSLLILQALYKLGQFVQNYMLRSQFNKDWKNFLNTHSEGEMSAAKIAKVLQKRPELLRGLKVLCDSTVDSAAEKRYFSELEMELDQRMQSFRNYLRLGPMLGLMGTLIPMGPALTGLASGDVNSMAGHMQVAFSTTVMGVFLGVIGFILYNKEKRWVAQDLFLVEYLSMLPIRKKQNESKSISLDEVVDYESEYEMSLMS